MPTEEAVAQAIYDAITSASEHHFAGEFQLRPLDETNREEWASYSVTIDGSFDLRLAAQTLMEILKLEKV